ncbi:GNAT family N-acetyltransferase [Micromonospora chalcea]|uniref:GNAT family N-acetyltransferase n=1 Tax=Micromonospora chalcea TaxID=1874 RepID=UPI003D702E4A
MSTRHARALPGWACADCGKDWPCAPARQEMILSTPPASLGMQMASDMTAAARDLPNLTPAELHRRFLGWLRSSPPTTGRLDLPVRRAAEVLHLGVMEQIGLLLQEALAGDPVLRRVAAGAPLDDIYDAAARLADVHATHLLHCEDVRVALHGNVVAGFVAGRQPLDPPAPGLLADYERDLVAAAGRFAPGYATARRERDAAVPRVPHYLLTHLVVHPDYRRKGVATGLLAHLHDLLDALGLPAHVTTTELLMRPLRARGYELDLAADGRGGPGVGMWRRAREVTPSLRI